MLARAVLERWPTVGYERHPHPVQLAARDAVATWSGMPSAEIALAVDGCGATVFALPLANMALAYAKLPDEIKGRIASLRARHSIEASFGAAMPQDMRLALKGRFPDAEHPVVRIHPETGEKVLFVNAFTTHFTNYHTPANVRYGQDANPGAADLLRYLISQAYIPEYQVRWRWRPNSVAIWDNRSTQHYAVMDYAPCHRKMERAGIVGDATHALGVQPLSRLPRHGIPGHIHRGRLPRDARGAPAELADPQLRRDDHWKGRVTSPIEELTARANHAGRFAGTLLARSGAKSFFPSWSIMRGSSE
jgi:hypothetical protein